MLNERPVLTIKFEALNGGKVYGYVVKPQDYTPGKRYPVVLLILPCVQT